MSVCDRTTEAIAPGAPATLAVADGGRRELGKRSEPTLIGRLLAFRLAACRTRVKFNAAVAAGSATGIWRKSGHPSVQQALRNRYFDSLGLPRIYVPPSLTRSNRRGTEIPYAGWCREASPY